MTPFEDWLVAELTRAEHEAKDESHIWNSFGAGYFAGYIAALKVVREKMTSELAGVLIE